MNSQFQPHDTICVAVIDSCVSAPMPVAIRAGIARHVDGTSPFDDITLLAAHRTR